MGRGLSDLQKRILDVLSDGERHPRYDISEKINGPYWYSDEPRYGAKYHGRVKVVSLSRAISRLHERGLIDIFTKGWCDHDPGWFWDGHPLLRRIQLTERGRAYLNGEDLPPLEKVVYQKGTKCPYCGVELPVDARTSTHKEHKLTPRGWRTEVIG